MSLVTMALLATASASAGEREDLRDGFNSHFFPERVGHPVQVGESTPVEPGEGWSCLTGLVAELKTNWDLFSPEEKAEMTAVLAPWRADLVEAPPPPGLDAPPSGCWDDYYPNVVESEHFSLQWEDGALTEAEAEEFLESLEYSWQVEVDENGWLAPAGVDSYPMMVLVPDNDSYVSAYTTTDYCSGAGESIPYIVAYSGSFRYGDWWKTMACHEFNHASQFTYGYGHEFWWWEATATYIEEIVYPEYNDWADMIRGWSWYPYLGLNAWAGSSSSSMLFYHPYGMSIWAFYLDEHVGGHDLIRETWEYSALFGGTYNLWMVNVLEGLRVDFDDTYRDFLAVSAVLDFEERAYYSDADRVDNVRDLPADGESERSSKPQSLGQNYITFKDSTGEPGMELEVTVLVEYDANREEPEWFILLVRGDDEVLEIVDLEIDETGLATGRITHDGEADIHLVLSPKLDDSYGYSYNWTRADEFEYEWSARLVDPNAVEDTGITGDDTGYVDPPEADDDDDDDGPTCACSGVGGAAGLLWLAGIAPLVIRRRR